MTQLMWAVLAALSAIFGGLLVYIVMDSQMRVLLSRQRQKLAAARATLDAQKEALETSLKSVEETTRRVAMDEFLADIRVEERHYTREQRVLFMTRKVLVRQERIFFRNIPLSNWVEQEMPYEEGADMDKLAQSMSVFASALLENPEERVRKILR